MNKITKSLQILFAVMQIAFKIKIFSLHFGVFLFRLWFVLVIVYGFECNLEKNMRFSKTIKIAIRSL